MTGEDMGETVEVQGMEVDLVETLVVVEALEGTLEAVEAEIQVEEVEEEEGVVGEGVEGWTVILLD